MSGVVLSYFRFLASPDRKERLQACAKLATTVFQEQQKFSKTRSSNNEPTSGSPECLCSDIKYSIPRILRGLCSSRDAVRQGLSLVLTLVLRSVPADVLPTEVLLALTRRMYVGNTLAASAPARKNDANGKHVSSDKEKKQVDDSDIDSKRWSCGTEWDKWINSMVPVFSGHLSRQDRKDMMLAKLFVGLILARSGRVKDLAPVRVYEMCSYLLRAAQLRKPVRLLAVETVCALAQQTSWDAFVEGVLRCSCAFLFPKLPAPNAPTEPKRASDSDSDSDSSSSSSSSSDSSDSSSDESGGEQKSPEQPYSTENLQALYAEWLNESGKPLPSEIADVWSRHLSAWSAERLLLAVALWERVRRTSDKELASLKPIFTQGFDKPWSEGRRKRLRVPVLPYGVVQCLCGEPRLYSALCRPLEHALSLSQPPLVHPVWQHWMDALMSVDVSTWEQNPQCTQTPLWVQSWESHVTNGLLKSGVPNRAYSIAQRLGLALQLQTVILAMFTGTPPALLKISHTPLLWGVSAAGRQVVSARSLLVPFVTQFFPTVLVEGVTSQTRRRAAPLHQLARHHCQFLVKMVAALPDDHDRQAFGLSVAARYTGTHKDFDAISKTKLVSQLMRSCLTVTTASQALSSAVTSFYDFLSSCDGGERQPMHDDEDMSEQAASRAQNAVWFVDQIFQLTRMLNEVCVSERDSGKDVQTCCAVENTRVLMLRAVLCLLLVHGYHGLAPDQSGLVDGKKKKHKKKKSKKAKHAGQLNIFTGPEGPLKAWNQGLASWMESPYCGSDALADVTYAVQFHCQGKLWSLLSDLCFSSAGELQWTSAERKMTDDDTSSTVLSSVFAGHAFHVSTPGSRHLRQSTCWLLTARALSEQCSASLPSLADLSAVRGDSALLGISQSMAQFVVSTSSTASSDDMHPLCAALAAPLSGSLKSWRKQAVHVPVIAASGIAVLLEVMARMPLTSPVMQQEEAGVPLAFLGAEVSLEASHNQLDEESADCRSLLGDVVRAVVDLQSAVDVKTTSQKKKKKGKKDQNGPVDATALHQATSVLVSLQTALMTRSSSLVRQATVQSFHMLALCDAVAAISVEEVLSAVLGIESDATADMSDDGEDSSDGEQKGDNDSSSSDKDESSSSDDDDGDEKQPAAEADPEVKSIARDQFMLSRVMLTRNAAKRQQKNELETEREDMYFKTRLLDLLQSMLTSWVHVHTSKNPALAAVQGGLLRSQVLFPLSLLPVLARTARVFQPARSGSGVVQRTSSLIKFVARKCVPVMRQLVVSNKAQSSTTHAISSEVWTPVPLSHASVTDIASALMTHMYAALRDSSDSTSKRDVYLTTHAQAVVASLAVSSVFRGNEVLVPALTPLIRWTNRRLNASKKQSKGNKNKQTAAEVLGQNASMVSSAASQQQLSACLAQISGVLKQVLRLTLGAVSVKKMTLPTSDTDTPRSAESKEGSAPQTVSRAVPKPLWEEIVGCATLQHVHVAMLPVLCVWATQPVFHGKEAAKVSAEGLETIIAAYTSSDPQSKKKTQKKSKKSKKDAGSQDPFNALLLPSISQALTQSVSSGAYHPLQCSSSYNRAFVLKHLLKAAKSVGKLVVSCDVARQSSTEGALGVGFPGQKGQTVPLDAGSAAAVLLLPSAEVLTRCAAEGVARLVAECNQAMSSFTMPEITNNRFKNVVWKSWDALKTMLKVWSEFAHLNAVTAHVTGALKSSDSAPTVMQGQDLADCSVFQQLKSLHPLLLYRLLSFLKPLVRYAGYSAFSVDSSSNPEDLAVLMEASHGKKLEREVNDFQRQATLAAKRAAQKKAGKRKNNGKRSPKRQRDETTSLQLRKSGKTKKTKAR